MAILPLSIVCNVLLAVAVIVLSVLLSRRSKASVILPTGASVTPMPGSTTALTLPADMSTANLAYYLKLNDGSTKGLEVYKGPFKTAFIADALVPVPNDSTDVDQLAKQCQVAYGSNGTLVAEAAIIAFMTHTSRDLSS